MGEYLTDISFDEWLAYVFDHAVTDPQWYWQDDRDYWNPDSVPAITVSYLTEAFENPVASFAPYSDAQLNQGLWFIVSPSGSNHMFSLKNRTVPLPERRQCIRAMYTLFEQLFFPRCSPNLGYIDEHDQGDTNPLDSVCYMWWDLIPIHGATLGPNPEIIADEMFDVMTQTLDLDSDACRESALHGLGHWHYYNPRRVESIIDEFLANHRQIRPELATYARRARKGNVQ